MILNTVEAGDGPVMVLLHGLFGAAKTLGVISRGLAPGLRVVAMDLRNHGGSPHDSDMNYATMAADVLETAAALGVGEAVVIGHSMGGKTAMSLALSRPDFVQKLAVLDIAPVAYRHDYDDYVRAMQAIKLTPDLTRHAAEAALVAAVPEPAMRGFLLNNLVLGADPHWRIGLDEICGAMPVLVGWADPLGWQPFTKPALFLRGNDSDYVRPEATDAILNRFPAAEICGIDGAGHWLHAEKPIDVIARLKEFLSV